MTTRHPFVSVIIPALDEEQSIGAVIDAIPRDVVGEVVVVDGGSRDGTRDVARDRGARMVSEPLRGYGRACAAGGVRGARRHRGVSRCRRCQLTRGHPGARRSHRGGERRSGARVAAGPGPRRGGAVGRHALPPAPGKQAGGAAHPSSSWRARDRSQPLPGDPPRDAPRPAHRRPHVWLADRDDRQRGAGGWRIIEVPVSVPTPERRPFEGERHPPRRNAGDRAHSRRDPRPRAGRPAQRRSATRNPSHRHARLPWLSSWRSAPCRARPRRVCARRSHPWKRPSCMRPC